MTERQRKRLDTWLKDHPDLNEELKNQTSSLFPLSSGKSNDKKSHLKQQAEIQVQRVRQIIHLRQSDHTSHMKIKKDVFYETVLDTLNGQLLKKTETRPEPLVKTVFSNRHKSLCFSQKYPDRENRLITGIVETDGTFKSASEKRN